MRAIIIGAGRGARLMPYTTEVPKCFAQINGKRLLDWGLEALAAGGFDDVVFIGGYRIEMVREHYPQFTFCHNDDWPNNNIMLSLMYAREQMADGFVCAYSDILYRPQAIEALARSPHDITLVCDTDWRSRYVARTEHPEQDGEKIAADGERVVAINRTMPSEAAHGEYIGVARFSAAGAASLLQHFDRAQRLYGESTFQGAKSFKKAYLICLFQEMIEQGVPFHLVETHGGYVEIDTTQDYDLATGWTGE